MSRELDAARGRLLRLRVTQAQGLLMIDLGLDRFLSVDASRTMRITDRDCEDMLKRIPRIGRVACNLRRKIAILAASKREQE